MLFDITLSDYIEDFLKQPEKSFGVFTRLALAMDEGLIRDYPEEFREFIRHVALSIRPVSPVIVCGADRDEAVSYVKPIMDFFEQVPDFPPITYGWKNGDEDVFPCPYHHDPIVLLPEKSRQDILSEAARNTGSAYPLVLEGTAFCPWCTDRYCKALARAEGIWQKLEDEIVLFQPIEIPEKACSGQRFVSFNRGISFYSVENKNQLPTIINGIKGGDQWPPVFGLLFVPVAEKELQKWKKTAKTATCLENYWILQAS